SSVLCRPPPTSTLSPYPTLFRSISRDHNLPVIQGQLVDAFPKFIATIASKFEDFDYHIMVVDTDAWWGDPWQCTPEGVDELPLEDRKSTRLNSSHVKISYAVFCL